MVCRLVFYSFVSLTAMARQTGLLSLSSRKSLIFALSFDRDNGIPPVAVSVFACIIRPFASYQAAMSVRPLNSPSTVSFPLVSA